MSKATLTKRVEFCSSHRYHNPDWDDAKNKDVFGPCNNENTHGHNYLLEVTLCGPIDPINGMIINLYDLKIYLWDILKEFDHKNLNLDTPYFNERIPTTENLAITLWEQLQKHPHMPPLDRIRLYEDHTLFADFTAEHLKKLDGRTEEPHADITRRYYFSAAHNLPNGQTTGHNYRLDVTVTGPIARDTGQVVNLETLDKLVQKNVLTQFEGKNLSESAEFQHTSVTEEHFAPVIWKRLEQDISGATLLQVTVSERADTLTAYQG